MTTQQPANRSTDQTDLSGDELDRFISTQYGRSPKSTADQTLPIERLRAVFEEVAEWKLEAKLEDNARYFFHVREVQLAEQGKRSYVIGRKGCGKTAIAEYLCRQREADTFSLKLTFKNFPFNELYELRDLGYAGPHQYITLWKFLIYSHVCQLMARNEAVEQGVRETLRRAYLENQVPTLPRRINRWLDREFGSELFGSSHGETAGTTEPDRRRANLIERVNKLEDILLQNLDSARYIIVFDELDEDYRNIIERQQYDQYSALITGLFKAVQDVRAVFSEQRYKLYPVVFLRDDIYEIIQDSDRTKWNDLKIALDWDVDRIKDLIAFRISRAVSLTAEIMTFDAAWHILFFRSNVRVGSGKKSTHSFDYIARSTHLRPRDFIQYLKVCCEEELYHPEKLSRVTPVVIKKVDSAFSNYLKSELIDEIHGVLPDISSIFDVLSQLRKWSFNNKEFIDAYNRQIKRGNLKERDPSFVLQILFLFSVLGHHDNGRQHNFRYLNKEARFNFDEQVIVHRGLLKALQLF
jgi:hypothetical protein